MEKKYITPSIKIRVIDNERIMAASPGLEEQSNGTIVQTGVTPTSTKTVDGPNVLSKQNVWDSDE